VIPDAPVTQDPPAWWVRYQAEAATFAAYRLEPSIGVAFDGNTGRVPLYPLLGAVEELSEFLTAKDDASSDLELGDLLWYLSELQRLWVVPWEDVGPAGISDRSGSPPDVAMIRGLGILAGKAKRYLREGAVLQVEADVAPAWRMAFAGWLEAVLVCDRTPEEIADLNLAKLRDRRARGQLFGSGDHR
jgi:hypothetical protein